ncbi:RNA-directed DNA polymerase (Reverse transcriptase), Ribonuclease H [Gossypium australe]|uniref:RNA-directed DNA polymerase (Reverse transcriptase), Ribonuclease H n=1 Tax=Gossypium australe TaxID=47621 RepID=A0A5B6VNP6_9ROSI|nr:RNA-directed DNA polymerase (Reverse transcriptase), Ribonuclease H [Gossypium australe]
MMQAYNEKVHPREFHEGDLVLKKILPIQKDFRVKWMPNWEGPYVVKKSFFGGALILTEMDGKSLPNPVNLDSIKKYFEGGMLHLGALTKSSKPAKHLSSSKGVLEKFCAEKLML